MLCLTGFKVELLLNNVVAFLRGLILKHLFLNGLQDLSGIQNHPLGTIFMSKLLSEIMYRSPALWRPVFSSASCHYIEGPW